MEVMGMVLVVGWFGGWFGEMGLPTATMVRDMGMPSVLFSEGPIPSSSKKVSEKEPFSQPSEKPSGKKKGEKSAEKQEKPEPDPFRVPEGSPEELLQYIEGLRQLQVKDVTTRDQMVDFLKKLHTAMVEAADKILAGNATDAQRMQAFQAKSQGLVMLMQLGDPTAEDRLVQLSEQLHKEGKKELARSLEGFLLLLQWREIHGQDEKKKHLGKIVHFLGEAPIGMAELRLMAGISQELEYQMPELAPEAYRQFIQLAGKSKVPIASHLVKRWEAVLRRLELLGKPIEIQGVTLDGKEFDWEKFRHNKLVLIDFWATWCGWCIKEIPELKRLYQAYRDRGFEIVGISGDRTRADLEKFLQNNEIPWTILYGKDGPSPTIEYYGISAWPTVLLVGKDGKVVSLNARGPKLREELQRLLGPVEEKNTLNTSPSPPPGPPQ